MKKPREVADLITALIGVALIAWLIRKPDHENQDAILDYDLNVNLDNEGNPNSQDIPYPELQPSPIADTIHKSGEMFAGLLAVVQGKDPLQ